MEEISELEITNLVAENDRRLKGIFEGYNPVTGEGCYDFENRVHVHLPDMIYPDMYVPKECFRSRVFRDVYYAGSIRKYIEEIWQKPFSLPLADGVQFAVLKARMAEDPEFAMFVTDKIVDKRTGKMINFRLNYPQRKLIALFEKLRHENKPILVVILKARQWGGSTLTQLYIKWLHDFRHPDGWNAIVLAQTKKTARKIKAMYRKATESQPAWTIGLAGARLKFAPYEGSTDDYMITDGNNPIRSSTLSIASFENFDSVRGDNFHCAHYSEVAYWKESPEHDPEGVISSVSGGILHEPENMEVFESTGKGTSGFFYDRCQSAMNPENNDAYSFIFIPFYYIENDMMKVENSYEFAKWLIANRNRTQHPAGYRESGKFFWKMWRLGATFEHIHWYRTTRNKYKSHAYMATEAPIDPVEAFKNSGKLVFDQYALDEMKDMFAREPKYRATICLPPATRKGQLLYKNAKLEYNEDGELKIWNQPNNQILRIKNRYLVSVDIGGKSDSSDFTVMTVLDCKGLMPEIYGRPQVVARWRGHIRHDKLAWIAAALAHYYDDALLVIESNTADRNKDSNTEGDHFGSIIEEIADHYPNLYMRSTGPEEAVDKIVMKYGFQTNVLTKQWVIDNMVAAIDEKLYDEPDMDAYKELRIYERRDDNSLGNIKGKNNHDDIVMSTAIGLWVASTEMDKPVFIRPPKKKNVFERRREPVTEATI